MDAIKADSFLSVRDKPVHPSNPDTFGLGKDYPSREAGWVSTIVALSLGGQKKSSSVSHLRSSAVN